MRERPVYRLCTTKGGNKYWVRSHYKFLRTGDVVKIKFGDNTESPALLVKSDPYIDQKNKEWTVDVAE